MKTLSGALLLSSLLGAIHCLHGLSSARRQGLKIPLSSFYYWPYLLFSVVAIVNTTLGVYIYTFDDADLGVSTALRTCSIVFALLIGRVLYRTRIDLIRCAQAMLLVLAGWFYVGCPSMSALLAMPFWILASLIIAFFSAIGEFVTAHISKENKPWQEMLAVIGAYQAVVSTVLICCNGGFSLVMSLQALVLLLLMCVLVSFQIMYRYKAYHTQHHYERGQDVVLKKFITISCYLIGSLLLGILVFGEVSSGYKLVGCLFALAGYALLLIDRISLSVSRVRVE